MHHKQTMSTLTVPAFTGRLAWRGRSLAILDPDILKRVDRPSISHSTASSMLSCPARFVAEKAMPRDPDPFAPTELGGATHTVLENLYGLEPAERTQDAAAQIVLDLSRSDGWPERLADEATRLRWTSAIMDNVLGDFAVESPELVDVVARELRVATTLEGAIPFYGVVDRIDRLEDGTLRISDYKTGKPKLRKPAKGYADTHGDQIREYKAALASHFADIGIAEKVSVGRVIYLGHGGGQRRVSIANEAEVRRSVAGLAAGWKSLRRSVEEGAFETRVSPLCGWCPFVNACPAAKAAGRVDRKGGAPSAAALDIAEMPVPARQRPARTTNAPAAKNDPRTGGGDPEKETAMGVNVGLTEGKPYAGQWVGDNLNIASYALQASGILTSMAVGVLTDAGRALTPRTVTAVRQTLEVIARRAQQSVFGTDDLDSSANTRVRYHLATSLRVSPVPFGADSSQWNAWVSWTTGFVIRLTEIDIQALADPIPLDGQPWRSLEDVPLADLDAAGRGAA